MEDTLAAALPRWLLERIGDREPRHAPGTSTEVRFHAATGHGPAGPLGHANVTHAAPNSSALAVLPPVQVQSYRLEEEQLDLHTTAPSDDSLFVHVPGTRPVAYMPRQVSLQRMAAALRLKIGPIFTRSDLLGLIAVVYMTVPNYLPIAVPTQLPFEGEPMPTPYTAVESACEAAIRYLRTHHHVEMDDVNYAATIDLTRKLAAAESFQMLHQEAAQAAIAAAATERQAHDVLLQKYQALEHSHAALQQHCAGLQQVHDAAQHQNAAVHQELQNHPEPSKA